jgi:tyrosyl-tRNA synthetase
VTEIVHGREAAEAAQKAAQAAFGGIAQVMGAGASVSAGAATLTDVPTYEISAAALNSGLKIVDVLAAAGLAPSKSAARRLVEQGGVRIGDRKVASVDDVVRTDEVPERGVLLHAGKKHLKRIVVKE